MSQETIVKGYLFVKRRFKQAKCILSCLALSLPFVAYATLSGSLDEGAIAKRLAPDAQVTVDYGTSGVAPVATQSGDIGKKRYEYTCKMCHDAGVAGSPKLSDKAAWQPRLSQGMETLIKHAIQGYKAMPPKGGCLTCDDEEIKKTVEYMVSKVK
jgi:cytochrome c5